jgi:hypothetical protein
MKSHIVLLLLLSGCAVHNPMSELVMFQKKTDEVDPVSYSRSGQIITAASHTGLTISAFSVDNLPLSGVTDYLNERSGSNNRYVVQKPISLTTNGVFMSPLYPDVAISIAIGFPIGLDLTAKVGNSLYATGSLGWSDQTPLNGQFILQKRLLDGDPAGLAIGAILVRNYVGYSVTESETSEYVCFLCVPPIETIATTSVGIRGLLVLNNTPMHPSRRRSYLYANAAFLYDMTMRLWYPKMGFSIGFY